MMAWTFFLVGGFLCVLNAYLSWLRYPLYRLRGGAAEEYRWVSGAPLFGSLFVLLGWGLQLNELESRAVDTAFWILVAIGTGGLHWFVISVIYHRIRGHGEAEQ